MRGVIRFLFAEGVKPVEIIHRMQAQYGDNYLSCSKIYEWIDHFKKRRTSVCDEKRSGRQSASRTENNIQPLKEWYGKTDELHWTNCEGFHMFGPMKEALRGGRKFSSDEESLARFKIG
jgi:transposase